MAMPSGLAKRVIPTVLLDGKRLVKGVRFKEYREAGLAKTTLRVLNAQEPDELIIINISKSQSDFEIAERIIIEAVRECEVPVTVGGGIRSIEDAENFFLAGVEKVLLTSAIVEDLGLVQELASRFGSQAVIAGIEFKDINGVPTRFIHAGSVIAGGSVLEAAKNLEQSGAGELLIVDIDNDGMKTGLNTNFLKSICSSSKIPVIGMGGVGNFSHLVEGFQLSQLDAIACGSLFTFGDNNPIRARSYLKNQGIPVRR
jgi:cyclase